MNQNNNILSIALICLLLISCGGGGGGSGGGALVQTPTPTYTQYVDFVNNGGTVPNVQGQIFRSRGQEYSTTYLGTDAEFESLSSITLQYSVPDASGYQSISMSGRVNWDGDPFSGSDTFTGTLDSNSSAGLILDNNLASVFEYQANTYVYTFGFVDFGGQRTVERTNYVTQLLQYRMPNDSGNAMDDYNFNYDFLAFVMGDQTWASDMPSSGTATYNGFTQMLQSNEYHSGVDAGLNLKYYLYGYSTFTADFANRDFSGQLDFEALLCVYCVGVRETFEEDEFVLNLNGTISGTSFSGTVTNPNLDNPNDDITSSFTGNFFGPNATELAGTFNYSNVNFSFDDGTTGSVYRIGTFTGCQGC